MSARTPAAVARDRALMRLRDLHPTGYQILYEEELAAIKVQLIEAAQRLHEHEEMGDA